MGKYGCKGQGKRRGVKGKNKEGCFCGRVCRGEV